MSISMPLQARRVTRRRSALPASPPVRHEAKRLSAREELEQWIGELREPSWRFLFISLAMGVIGFGFAILLAVNARP